MSLIRRTARKIPGLHYLYLRYVEMKEVSRLKGKSADVIFNDIYAENRWNSNESISGPGSTDEQTRAVVEQLPRMLKGLEAKTVLDIPCGDFNWLRNAELNGFDYLGADIVPALIKANAANYSSNDRSFCILNLLEDVLPTQDVIFCRDCLVHFSNADVMRAIRNIHRSGSRYLITTSFVEHENSRDIYTGQWRPLNLLQAPFQLPEPMSIFREGCTEGGGIYFDKALCIWEIEGLSKAIDLWRS